MENPPESNKPVKDWPHAPVHRLEGNGNYMVTAATVDKVHLFQGSDHLDALESSILKLSKQYGWQLEAWSVFPNHYHFIARGNPDSKSLRQLITHIHSESARELNKAMRKPGRKVWHNFWDSKLTFERSYLARLNYVHQNPVKHGMVPVANQYRWCSAAWFERTATPAQVKTIYSFKTDGLDVPDDF
ncbi:MAG TPA: transposase [Verrucomicrobiae bacterium]